MAVAERNLQEVPEREQLSFNEKEIETIKRTIAKDANADEFRMYMHLARNYGLDPFNKEIFFWKIDGKPTIMTSRDGYLKIADRHPQYDGLVSDVIRKNDKFKKQMEKVDHEYGTSRGNIIGAYALVYRKDRRFPIYSFAPMEEYNAHTRVWNNYPSAMILKVAESMALKRAFTVSGLVSREEMGVIKADDDEPQSPKDITPPREEVDEDVDRETEVAQKEVAQKEAAQLSDREEEIKEIIGEHQGLKKDLYSYLTQIKREKDLAKEEAISLNDLSQEQYEELKDMLLTFKELEEQKPA